MCDGICNGPPPPVDAAIAVVVVVVQVYDTSIVVVFVVAAFFSGYPSGNNTTMRIVVQVGQRIDFSHTSVIDMRLENAAKLLGRGLITIGLQSGLIQSTVFYSNCCHIDGSPQRPPRICAFVPIVRPGDEWPFHCGNVLHGVRVLRCWESIHSKR